MVTKRPKGRIPNNTRIWLEVNKDVSWQEAVCKCGRWYHRMDKLAPYHLEKCWCPRCGYADGKN